ncbi:MAG TPA: transposase [Kofleriaceae bacterium]|nr:transposase [Kofleriaceae bacterium]
MTCDAFCIATDATGVLVQPIAGGDQVRRACRRGHYFVQIADADHVFFEYTPKETSAVVGEMFRGFSGYIQADAKSVYDLLFRAPDPRPADDGDPDLAVRHEVGCWAHARRKFWEAAITKDAVAREGLERIARIFALDRSWRGKPVDEIKSLREACPRSARSAPHRTGLRPSPARSADPVLRRWSPPSRQHVIIRMTDSNPVTRHRGTRLRQ